MKSLKVTEETHARLEKLGAKGQSFDDIIEGLLGETWHIEKLKSVLAVATEKNERAKRGERSGLALEAASAVTRALSDFIEAVEKR